MKSITEQRLDKVGFLALHKWYSLVHAGQRKQARDQAQVVIDICKNVLKGTKPGENPEKRNIALILGILFRGLQDFIDLSETISSPNWKIEPSLIEKAWIQMWDCKERIEYVSNFCKEKTLNWLLSRIESLEIDFLANLGPGLYSSPEILIKREICSICKNDFRSCDHIISGIYDGIRCVSIPQDIQLRSVSIVEVPEDPRCRIWPWQFDENKNKIENLCIMTSFRLDDFMDESNEKD